MRVLKDAQLMLKDIKLKLKDGKIEVGAFKDKLRGITGPDAVGGGLVIKQSDDTFLEKVYKLEEDLAKAKTIYMPSSKIVKNLERSLSVLQPDIKKAPIRKLKNFYEFK